MNPIRQALVLGLGASGKAAASLLRDGGATVVAVDGKGGDPLAATAQELRDRGVEVLLEAAALPDGEFDLCVVSPGLDASHPWILEADRRGIPVVSELEVGGGACRCPMLAITGSNGKSSLAKLCGESLAAAGLRVAVGGNYGEPLCALAPRSADLDWAVVEVSSFQLERVVRFRPRVGVLLNLQPNHLNRHGSLEAYGRAKSRLFANMEPGDTAVVPVTDRIRMERWSGGHPRWKTFGLSRAAQVRYEAGAVVDAEGGPPVAIAATWFDNPVMGLTAAAAVAAVNACGADAGSVGRAAGKFVPLPHRMTLVQARQGIRFVDDSKATNLAAMRAALEMIAAPVRLIAGGQLKEDDLAVGKNVLESTVRGAYLLGRDAEKLEKAWGGRIPCRVCLDLETAVTAAWRDAQPGETILLSPACASFDQFSGFEERGGRFAELVAQLEEER